MSADYMVRVAVLDDIPALVAYRRAMFESMGITDDNALSRMSEAMTGYLVRAMISGEYRAWVAEAAGAVVASGGLVIHCLPPSPRNIDGREGYILNIYTVPEWRGHGIASAVTRAILDYLHEVGVPVATLHASDAGRPIYERLGFAPTNEMRLILRGPFAKQNRTC